LLGELEVDTVRADDGPRKLPLQDDLEVLDQAIGRRRHLLLVIRIGHLKRSWARRRVPRPSLDPGSLRRRIARHIAPQALWRRQLPIVRWRVDLNPRLRTLAVGLLEPPQALKARSLLLRRLWHRRTSVELIYRVDYRVLQDFEFRQQ